MHAPETILWNGHRWELSDGHCPCYTREDGATTWILGSADNPDIPVVGQPYIAFPHDAHDADDPRVLRGDFFRLDNPAEEIAYERAYGHELAERAAWRARRAHLSVVR